MLATAVGNLKATYAAKPVEKVYLHLDKPNYIPGDTLWFKAYTVVGETHNLSALSGVLYVELINPKDSVMRRLVLRLTSGISKGEFTLANNLKAGIYQLRAYTNWMKNAGADYFYTQRINIGRLAPNAIAPAATLINPDVQFFPEGGDLVAGIRSKVAFKAIGQNGAGQSVKGSILDNDNNVAAEFESSHAGMGVFALVPQPGKIYTAKIIQKDGSTFTVPIQKILDEGYTFSVNNSRKDSLFIKVAVNGKFLQSKLNTPFFIIAQSGGKSYFTAEGLLKNPVLGMAIDKKRFPTGVVQFTLFAGGQPVCERVAFIQNNDGLKIDLASAAKTYGARSGVKLDVLVKNALDEPVAGTFSIAVINESRLDVDEQAEGSILSHLLLTSDIKGYIEKPNYYFVDPNDQKRAELDVLMLTQGYRRFEWKQVITAPDSRITDMPEKGLSLEGTVKTTGGDMIAKGKLMLTAPRENVVLDTVTDTQGNFKFSKLELSDTSKIVLQARKQNNGRRVSIFIQQPAYPKIIKSSRGFSSSNDLPAEEMKKKFDVYTEQLNQDSLKNGSQLNGVTVTAKRINKGDPYAAGRVMPQRNVDMKRADGIASLKALVLQQPFYREVEGELVKTGKQGGPVDIYLDGGISSLDALIGYLPSEVESLTIGLPGDIVDGEKRGTPGGRPSGGYIVVTTKRIAGTDTTVLKQVTVIAKKLKRTVPTRSANLHGAGNADQVIFDDKLGNCASLADCLRGKVFGVSFKADGTPVNISRGSSQDMVIIVEGVQLQGSELNNINASDVVSIEVIRTNFAKSIYGSSIGGGALIITLKNGSEKTYASSDSPTGLITYPFKGYHKARTYYTPKYTAANQTGGNADLRSGIYWNPDVLTGKDGKASFTYFNADTKGTYRVVVEGIDDDGNLGRQVYRYKVE
ncbi:hypothetical protein A0256_03560 [Mucilaginibacter sp. PAMC 26640]|nr:hypothetical protein A0256_03560 [Mucilaginibacter sp. PAMC 26640]